MTISEDSFDRTFRPFCTRAGRVLAFAVAVWSLLLSVCPSAAAQSSISTFDAPWSTNPLCVQTAPAGINSKGSIVGFYQDETCTSQGFLRAADGSFTKIEVPGDSSVLQRAIPTSINEQGTVTGFYIGLDGNTHGFLRAVDGSYKTLDPPGLSPSAGTFFVFPQSINARGDVTGYYSSGTGSFAFLQTANGTFTSFNVQGSTVFGPYTLTMPRSINPSGDISGKVFIDVRGGPLVQSFVRTPDGKITTFDPPWFSNLSCSGSVGLGIDGKGAMIGNGLWRCASGYLRSLDGSFTKIEFPGAAVTLPLGMNPAGAIAGDYMDANGAWHGFVRTPNGVFTTFDIPGADSYGPSPTSMSANGAVTGTFNAAPSPSNIYLTVHGFVLTP